MTSDELKSFEDGLRSLQIIPGVVSINFGVTTDTLYKGYIPRDGGYNYILVVILQDSNALEVYDKSEFHTEVKHKYIFPMLDTTKEMPVLALDFNGFELPNNSSL